MGFKDKVVLVTGSGRGIGKAIALAFARQGATVAINGINVETCLGVCREICQIGGKGIETAGDVSESREVKKIFQKIIDECGKIDILVNNAGIVYVVDCIDTTNEQWDRTMAVNCRGVFLCSREAVRIMMNLGKGKIINIASQAGKTGAPHYSHYCASKFAVVGFTQSLGREVARYGINVNAVCPGIVDSDMLSGEIEEFKKFTGKSNEKLWEEFTEMVPLGRLETPDDVANLVLFLASDQADYMTGQAFNITGGLEVH
jgi:meso-butanediol dehydrogenase/(S,S)-butanediol dehydrogenase/diacetyl reductase